MSKRRLAGFLCSALLLAGTLLPLSGCRRSEYSASWFDVFDTVVIFTGYTRSRAEWDKQAEAVHDDLLRCHRLFDIYHEYDGLTNLATVNREAAAGPVKVDAELYEFLRFGKEMYTVTDGACSIAAGAVLRLWHDARELENPVPPADDALTAAAAHCDIDDLILDDAAQTVAFADPALRLDVGAIGKGYAVELAAKAAEARGLTSALLNAGGNVRAIGTKPGGKRWTAGVESPWQPSDPPTSIIELEPGESLVVSGNYQRYFEYEGVRYHHLIDLTTSQPARYADSVAVRCMLGSGLGDALSTGLFCMPVEQGLALVNSDSMVGVEALWLEPGCTTASPGWNGDPLK